MNTTLTPIQSKLKTLLEKGVPANAASKKLKISRRYAFDTARRHNWNTNPPTPPGGRRERQILAAMAAGFTASQVGDAFNLAPSRVQDLLKRANSISRRFRLKLVRDHKGRITKNRHSK